MDLPTIVQAFQRNSSTLPCAIRVLFNYANPLSKREATQLAEFHKWQLENETQEGEIPENIKQLNERPIQAISGVSVIQCVLGAAKIPSFPIMYQRSLQRQLLHKVTKNTHLTLEEWIHILQLTSTLPMGYSATVLRCAEEILKASASFVFNSSKVDNSTISETSDKEKEIKKLFLKIFASVVSHYATRDAESKKHSILTNKVCIQRGQESFLTRKPLKRLQRIIKENCDIKSQEDWRSAALTLSPAEIFTLYLTSPWKYPITRDMILQTIKSSPTLMIRLLGKRPIPGSLIVDSPDDIIQFCVYNMGLTNCSTDNAQDYLAILMALSEEYKSSYYKVQGKDGFIQLLTPFINNSKVLTFTVAQELQDLYCNFLIGTGIEKDLLPLFIQATSYLVLNRCRTATEKASIMTITSALMKILPKEIRLMAPEEELSRMIERELASPAIESASAAWKLLNVSGVEKNVADEMRTALKNSKNNENLRRVMLLYISSERAPDDVIKGLIEPLLEECSEVEVYRPDAFLALRFAIQRKSFVISKLCSILCKADVLGQLGNNKDELECLAETAIILAKEGIFAPIALLLTHKSGLLRYLIYSYVASFTKDASAIITLWDIVTRTVFGLEQKEKPKILSSTAINILFPVASALLQHTNKTAVSTTLYETILCCGHDHIQGEDPFYYYHNGKLLGRERKSSKEVNRQIFEKLFSGEHLHLLTLHSETIAEKLCESFNAPSHISIAASRGLVLLLTFLTNTVSSERVFEKLLKSTKISVEYMNSLDARDRAIAATSITALQEYENIALREQQLLKTYTEKPPKGMSEDDYEDMKRKDAIALEKGREILRKEIEKRTHIIEETVRQHKTSLATIRTLGTTGFFRLEGISTLYPYLQDELNRNDIPEVLKYFIIDAISGLFSRTVFAYMSENIACTVAQLYNKISLSVSDVSRISTMALHLRKAITQMIPAPLFVILIPFSKVAFKAGRGGNAVQTTIPVATQHQILGVLIQNLGQTNLPQPTETLQLLSTILQSFPSLYKSIQQGVNLLMAMIPASHLNALEIGLFSNADAVKGVIAVSYHRFSHFATCRRALVLASILIHDSSPEVKKSMKGVIEDSSFAFSLNPTDWMDLVYYLQTYGKLQRSHSLLIGETMRELFVLPSTTESQQRIWLKDLKKIGGLGAVVTLEVISSSLKGDAFQDAILFLCDMAESPSTEPLMRLVLTCGRVVLNDCTLETLKSMTRTLQTRLGKPPRDITPAHKELYLAISTVWLTIISCRLKETSLLESIIEQQSSTLNNSTSAMVHRSVCDSMIEITKNEDVRASPKLDEFVEKCLKQTIHAGSYIKKKAHAYGLVGVLNGLGLTSLRRYHIMETMQTAVKEKQVERSGVMVLLEVMTEIMGAKFEPYALAMCSGLLEGVADKDHKVSECADDASRVMVSSLTSVGLRQLIPRLIDGLSADHAKMRVPPLNFIGYVAFCSPKQLAATLPEITKHINACLFDVNHNVSSAAMSALRRVAGVVSNTEIKEHVEVILNALRSPNTETENALDALLYTRFVNAVDPASLALIIPILARGLSNQMPRARPKAAQIVASMVNLVNDPKSLKPYSEELVHLLEEAAVDPNSESRTTSAKAIAALSAAIGGKLIDDVVAWCFTTLQKSHVSSIEKAGAAQVFVEVVESCGESILRDSFPTVAAGMMDERPPVREGFLHIMVYSPSTFSPSTFQNFLPISFPWVLEGLSHFSDRVRDVALAAGSSIINLYGTRNLALVVEPLLRGVVSEVATLRHSSMLLSSKLLIHLVQHIRKKMRIQLAKESLAADAERNEDLEQEIETIENLDNNGGLIQLESARDVEKRGISILGSLEEVLGTESFIQLLSSMYVGRHEHNLSVRTDANTAWQACVASLRGAVKKIFKGLVDMLIHFSSSEDPDCVEMSLRTIEFTSRLNEMIEPFVEELCIRYKDDERRSKLGALICLAKIVVYMDSQRLISVGGQIVGCVLPGMQEKDARIQQCAREVFAAVSKSVGPTLIESAIKEQMETSVRGVVEVVKVKPGVALDIIFKYLSDKEDYTQNNLELLDAILDVEEADEQMRHYVNKLNSTLLKFVIQGLDGATDTYQKFVENLNEEFEHLPVEHWLKALRSPVTQCGALLAAESYGMGVSIDYIEGITSVFRAAIESLGSEDDELRRIAVTMIPNLISSLEQRVVESLEEEEQQDLTISKRAAGRYLLQYLDVFEETLGVTARSVVTEENPEFTVLGEGEPIRLFDALMAFYNRGLDYGTPMQKVQAVECIQDLLTYAPRKVSAGAANTVAGRCSKVLFTRNEGKVVLALVKLCLLLMDYPASGKEKMVEGTMALAMFNASLCDDGEARLLALRVVIQLLQRSEKYADLILSTVITKKSTADSPLFRSVMCRFISVVIRYSNFTKALGHITKLMDIVLPIWERAETPATTAVGGVAVAALCKSATVTEDQLHQLQEKALAMMATKGTAALGGFAFVHSLLTSCPGRVGATFVRAAAGALRSAAGFGAGDKLTAAWLLRGAGAVIASGALTPEEAGAESYAPLLRRVDQGDEAMMSTAQYFHDAMQAHCPAVAATLADLPHAPSPQWDIVGHFDADLDDELTADTVF